MFAYPSFIYPFILVVDAMDHCLLAMSIGICKAFTT
jgi:hypothetical protein